MQRKVKVMAIAAVIALVLAMPVAAQSIIEDIGELQSNTSLATAGLFGNDVDNFVNYHEYSSVLADGSKWFGFITGRNDVGGLADLGYATSFGGLYLGAWYRGNIVRLASSTETHTIRPTWDNNLEILTQRTDTTSFDSTQWLDSANNFEFLIGVAGQGIKVGFFESYGVDQNAGNFSRSISITDTLDGRKDYANAVVDYQRAKGWLRPYLGWGTNLSIGDMTLKPFVDLAFQIYDDKLVDNYESYTEVNGVKQAVVGSVGAGGNNGTLTPIAAAGAWLDLAKKDTTQSQLFLRYEFQTDLYNNDYSATGLSGDAVAGTVRWDAGYVNRETLTTGGSKTETDLTLNFNEQTSISNTVVLGYQVTSEPFENFKLGFNAGIPVSFDSSSSNSYSRKIEKTAEKFWNAQGYVHEVETIRYDQFKTERSTLGLGLQLGLGAQYKLFPDRFAINVGVSAKPLGWTYTTTKNIPNSISSIKTEKITQDDGSVTQNDKTVSLYSPAIADEVTVSDSWDPWTATLSGGFVFNFTPNVALDLNIYATSADSFRLALNNVNVLFTFKF